MLVLKNNFYYKNAPYLLKISLTSKYSLYAINMQEINKVKYFLNWHKLCVIVLFNPFAIIYL